MTAIAGIKLRTKEGRLLLNSEVDNNFTLLDGGIDQLRAALNVQRYGDGPYPVLDAVFGGGASILDPRITFTRVGDSYRIVNGVLRKYDPNEPVLTGAALDTRPAETNLVGADIAGSDWAIAGSRLTMGPVVEVAGFSLRKATVAVESVSGSYVAWSPQIPVSPGKVTLTAYLKQDTPGWAFLSFRDDATSKQGYAYYDLATGTVGHKNQSSGWSVIATTMEALSDGVWRLDLVVQTDGTQVRPSVYGQCAGNVNQGSVGLSGNVWYAAVQVNQGDPIPYIPTTDSAVTRPADNVSIQDSSGAIFNPDEGALIWRGEIAEVGGAMQRIVSADETGIQLSTGSNGSVGIYTVTEGVASTSAFTPSAFGATGAFGITWKSGGAHLWGRGTDYGSIPVDMSAVDRFYAFTNTKEKWHLYQRLTIFNQRPGDAQMGAWLS